MYLIKIKGKAKIPNYVQIRDKNFTLIVYFREDRPEKHLIKAGLEHRQAEIFGLLPNIPYGKMIELPD